MSQAPSDIRMWTVGSNSEIYMFIDLEQDQKSCHKHAGAYLMC